MILIDTSAWIEYFRQSPSHLVSSVHRALDEGDVVVGDLILTELLQGIRHEAELKRVSHLLGELECPALGGREIAELAASNFRFLRRRGVTIRGTIDVIVATWCIVNDVRIVHNDRDLRAMEVHLGLRSFI